MKVLNVSAIRSVFVFIQLILAAYFIIHAVDDWYESPIVTSGNQSVITVTDANWWQYFSQLTLEMLKMNYFRLWLFATQIHGNGLVSSVWLESGTLVYLI